jgi:trigger factor
MKVKITPKKEVSQVELEVTVPAKDFAPFIKRAAKELSTTHPLSGFRPGAAPVDVVVANFGQERVLRQAMDDGLPHLFIRAVVKNNIEAIGRPSIAVQELGLETDFRFVATVAVMPEVTLGDVSTIKVTRHPARVTDADVEHELKQLARMRATYLAVARPAAKGDTVVVDFRVAMNGQVMEGGESKNHPIQLGEGHFVPDFEQQLTGMSAGQERTFTITFPADFAREELRGQEAQVWVKVHDVQKRVTPELNDEFAQKIGKFTSLQHLKDELKKNLQHDREHKEQDRLHGELSEKLAAISTFASLPDVLIDKEIDNRLEELKQFLGYQGKTLEQYLADRQKTLADIRAELKEPATASIKVALALRAFSEQEKVSVAATEIDERVATYLQRFDSVPQAEGQVNKEELRDNIASTLRNQRALKRLEEIATIEDAPEEAKGEEKEKAEKTK